MTMALILSVPRRLVEGARRAARRAGMERLVADLDARPPHLAASGSASSAWAASARPSRGARAPSASPSTITTAAPSAPRLEEELEATYWDSLDQMLARVDIVSVNCPATPATYHLLSRRRLKLMRAGRRHREHRARLDHRRGGADRGAGDGRSSPAPALDVFEHEPAVNPKLIKLAKTGKVVLLPHMGSATLEGRIDMGETVIINIRTWMDGHKPPDRVLPSTLVARRLPSPAGGKRAFKRRSGSVGSGGAEISRGGCARPARGIGIAALIAAFAAAGARRAIAWRWSSATPPTPM